MKNTPYSEKEMARVRELCRENMTDEDICKHLMEEFGITRTHKALARMRGREGITKLNIRPYIPKVQWSQKDVEFVRDNFETMTDVELAAALGRTESAIIRIRGKHFYIRSERFKKVVSTSKTVIKYKKHFIQGGMTDAEKNMIDWKRKTYGTYGNPVQ